MAFEWNKFVSNSSFRQRNYGEVLSFQHALVVGKLQMTANEAWSSFVVAQLWSHCVVKTFLSMIFVLYFSLLPMRKTHSVLCGRYWHTPKYSQYPLPLISTWCEYLYIHFFLAWKMYLLLLQIARKFAGTDAYHWSHCRYIVCRHYMRYSSAIMHVARRKPWDNFMATKPIQSPDNTNK